VKKIGQKATILLTTKHFSLNKAFQHMSLCFQNPDVLRRTFGQLQNTTPVMQAPNIMKQLLFTRFQFNLGPLAKTAAI
jgi:hypothetical protein